MQLTQLEIKGFKSFGDKITINFNKGVTAIVGPNGCGKSNVVDAIRWVLGEQSTRMLRSEKMDNVIFNGTKSRKAANLAEVSLTFDNTRNILPTDFSQVTLTRRLYRTGESEYRLNDVQCRLKDITDLFLDTGVGADSYAIIELKMIDEIINNKEGSRRNLFEEASGISKYKLRKKQTFGKLKDTEADLERVNDLLFEIDKNLKTLENQAKKTELYYKLKEQYKTLSIALASFRIDHFGNTLAIIEQKEQTQRTEKAGIITRIDTMEAVLQQDKLDSLTREKNLAAQQKASNEFIARIRAYESEKRVRNEQLKNLQDKEARLKDELERDNNQHKHIQYNIRRLSEEKELEETNLQGLTLLITELKAAVDALKASQNDSHTELTGLNAVNNRLQNQVYKAVKDIEILQIQQQALEQESLRNMEDTAGREVELLYFKQVMAELTNRLEALNIEYEQLVTAENLLQEQLTHTDIELKIIKDNIAAESRKLDARQNEYNLTKSMIDNLEGFPESIRFLKKNTAWSKNITLFSDVLFCRVEYRIAIENYLEPLMNHYVVNTYNEAIAAINLLSDSASGRAQFFILDNYLALTAKSLAPPKSSPEGRTLEQKVSPSERDLEGAGNLSGAAGAIPALSVIEVDERYQALCHHLLKNVYLVNDYTGQDLNNSVLSDDVVLIGKSGKFSKARYTMAGGSVGLFEGKRIGRAKNLDNLLKEIKQTENHISALKINSQQLENKLSEFRLSGQAAQIKQKQTELNQLNTELVTVKTRQEQYQAFMENSLNRKQDIADKINSIKHNVITLQPQLTELNAEKQIHNDLLTERQQAFNILNELFTAQSNTYNQENIRLHQQQNKVAGLTKDLEYRASQLNHLDSRITQNNADLENVRSLISENLHQTGHSDESLLEMYVQKENLEKGTQEAEQEYYAWRGRITESEQEVLKLRHKKDNTEVIENALKDERNNLKLELNALKERLSVEFNIDINDLPEQAANQEGNENEIRERAGKLKRQLDDFGAINPMAVEAYNEMNERHTFIQAQKKDLADAKASLLATIQEIDSTAREKFMSAFINVRENFIKVFRSLFNEEDSCDLILSDPSHPLESEIDIIAKPKGKRPLSINQLSGGEKTLTATAILFSLYLLKPAPFCIFDEVDAPLDDTNIDKFNNIIRRFSNESQFIIISHNKRTIACTDVIYGVTMVEQGISRLVPVDLRELAD